MEKMNSNNQSNKRNILDNSLMNACYFGNICEMKELIKEGADIYVCYDVCLYNSLIYKRIDSANYLMDIDRGNKWNCYDCLKRFTCDNLCEEYKK